MAKYMMAKSEEVTGGVFKDTIIQEKMKHYIGETVCFNKNKGIIVGIYPDFALVRYKNYNECVLWKDFYFKGVR